MTVYALATAQQLLRAIDAYEAVDCDCVAVSVAWLRWSNRTDSQPGDVFRVRGHEFPHANFAAVHLVLTPLVRLDGERRTLAPVAAFLTANRITHLCIVGSGSWDRRHEYSRNDGASWGRMPLAAPAPAQPAPTQVRDARIGPAPERAEEAS